LDRNAVLTPLREQHNFQFDQRADLHSVDARLSEAASRTLNDINDQVGGVGIAVITSETVVGAIGGAAMAAHGID
jgi:hypothetical protein